MGGIAGGLSPVGASAGATDGRADFRPAHAGTWLRRRAQDSPQEAAPHVRSYFPEALYINPEIITDAQGNANISIPVADSITTWRMAMLASTASRRTRHRHLEPQGLSGLLRRCRSSRHAHSRRPGLSPIAVYNYSGKPGQVSLKLKREDWFSLDHDTPEKSVAAESGRVGCFAIHAHRHAHRQIQAHPLRPHGGLRLSR